MIMEMANIIFGLIVLAYFIALMLVIMRVRSEIIVASASLQALVAILRQAHGVKTGRCNNCKSEIPYGQPHCSSCGHKLVWV